MRIVSRIVSVWLPDLPVERLRRGRPPIFSKASCEAPPLALVTSGGRGVAITAVDRPAAAKGIHVGQRLADARAMLPGLATARAMPGLDAAALGKIVAWAGRYGPLRNAEGADGFWVDISGVAHLFGGEAALLRDLDRRLRAAGFTAQAAAADTHGAAFALARYDVRGDKRCRIAPPGTVRAALAGLPVAALRLGAPTVQLLHRLGLARIGQLYEIPRPSLALRFREAKVASKTAAAEAVGVLMRLDQALGEVREPRAPLVVPPAHSVRRVFQEPLITAEGVAAATEELALDLCEALEAAAKGARGFVLSLYRADGGFARVHVRTSRPCREARHILQLLGEKLAALDLGFGVDVATLDADELGAMAEGQARLAGGDTGDAAIAGLIDRLSNRLGAGQVSVLAARSSHIPERAELRVAALAGRPASEPAPGRPPTRPPFLLSPPEPVEVEGLLPDGAPGGFVWRRLRHRVAAWDGPERIAPEWWRHLGGGEGKRGGTRDYYRLEDHHGGRFWLFREHCAGGEGETPKWYLHGMFG
jgi:protein ImuB